MLDSVERRNIDEARDVLVGKIPDPKAQVEQITIGMIYKFMNDIDVQTVVEFGGARRYFYGEFEKYAWNKLFDRRKSANDVLNLYRDALASMSKNPNIPPLFRQIFDKAFLNYNDPGTLKMFLWVINRFSYNNPENLGNAFEYLLSILSSQGAAGQFRTPRNIIEFMVDVTDPQKNDRILDPACGTGGFLIYAWRHILKYNSPNFNPEKDVCAYENSQADIKDHVINGAAYKGENLTFEDRQSLMNGLEGYDISPDMVRLALVNMYLHDIKNPKIAEYDTLTSDENWNQYFDCVFSNPPFMSPKGGIRPHGKFSIKSSRSEVLFVDYIMNHLSTRGKAAVIVPEGIIFQSQNAYKELRKELVENYLIAVVSLPAGVFNPYSGVKTSVLLLDRQLAKKTDGVLFVKVENDGYGLGAQRKAIAKNDLPKSAKAIKAYKAALNKGMKFNPEEFDNALLTPKSKIAENGEYNLSGERYKERNDIVTKYKMLAIEETIESVKFSNKILRSKYLTRGKYPIIDQSDEFITGFWNNEDDVFKIKKPVILFGDHTRCFKYIDFDFVLGADGIKILLPIDDYNSKFYYYLLNNLIIKSLGYSRHFKQLKEIQIPLPPLSVQEEIVAEIEGFQKIIDGARQVVENWKPRIDIDPEWQIIKMTEIADVNPESKEPSLLYKDWFTYIDISCIENGSGIIDYSNRLKVTDAPSRARRVVRKNDILLSTVRPNLKAFGFIEYESNRYIASTGFAVLRTNSKCAPKYLYYLVFQDFIINQIIGPMEKGAYPSINQNDVNNLEIALPPIEIQNQIVSQIEEEQEIVNGNKRLIEIYEQKIKDRIAKVWGE